MPLSVTFEARITRPSLTGAAGIVVVVAPGQPRIAGPSSEVISVKSKNQVFPGEPEVQYEAVEVVVYRLRKKLAATGAALVTLRGLGYLLKAGG